MRASKTQALPCALSRAETTPDGAFSAVIDVWWQRVRREELLAKEGLRQHAAHAATEALTLYARKDLVGLERLAELERQPLARIALFSFRRVLWAQELFFDGRAQAAETLLSHAGIKPFLRAKESPNV